MPYTNRCGEWCLNLNKLMKSFFIGLFSITISSLCIGQSDSTRTKEWPNSTWGYSNYIHLSTGGGIGYSNGRIVGKFEIGFDIKKTGCIPRLNELTRHTLWYDYQSSYSSFGYSKNWMFRKVFKNTDVKIIRSVDLMKIFRNHFTIETGIGVANINSSNYGMIRLSPKLYYTIQTKGYVSFNLVPYYLLDFYNLNDIKTNHEFGFKLLIHLRT